jgi:hypothetical protein
MAAATRWTAGVAVSASLCAAAIGLGSECAQAETPRFAEVVAIGPPGAWTQPLTRDCAEASQAASALLVVLRYRDGSRYERRWRTARVRAAAGLHLGDTVRFDPASCSVSSIND